MSLRKGKERPGVRNLLKGVGGAQGSRPTGGS